MWNMSAGWGKDGQSARHTAWAEAATPSSSLRGQVMLWKLGAIGLIGLVDLGGHPCEYMKWPLKFPLKMVTKDAASNKAHGY